MARSMAEKMYKANAKLLYTLTHILYVSSLSQGKVSFNVLVVV